MKRIILLICLIPTLLYGANIVPVSSLVENDSPPSTWLILLSNPNTGNAKITIDKFMLLLSTNSLFLNYINNSLLGTNTILSFQTATNMIDSEIRRLANTNVYNWGAGLVVNTNLPGNLTISTTDGSTVTNASNINGVLFLTTQTNLSLDFSSTSYYQIFSTYILTNIVTLSLTNIITLTNGYENLYITIHNLSPSNLIYSLPTGISWVSQVSTNTPTPTNILAGQVQLFHLLCAPIVGTNTGIIGYVN